MVNEKIKSICGENVLEIPGGITVEYVQLTKKICQDLLANLSPNQRVKKKRNLSVINQNLKDGNWLFNGATIVVNWNGELDDGQHRLTEFLKTGIYPSVLIVKGTDPKAAENQDTGTPRTIADFFKWHGVKNHVKVSTVAMKLAQHDYRKMHGGAAITRRQLWETYLKHEESIEFWLQRSRLLDQLLPVTLRVAVSVPAELVADRETVTQFWKEIETGIGSRTTLTLRKLLARESLKVRKTLSKEVLCAVVFKAMQKYIDGKEAKLLRWDNSEPFPYFY